MALISDPGSSQEFYNKRAIIFSELHLHIGSELFNNLGSVHVSQPYLPALYTPLCYGQTFPFANEAKFM